MKKSLNLTIDSELIGKAKKFASSRNISLSNLIEEKLKQIASPPNLLEVDTMFSNFHKKHLGPSFKEPSTRQIEKWCENRKK